MQDLGWSAKTSQAGNTDQMFCLTAWLPSPSLPMLHSPTHFPFAVWLGSLPFGMQQIVYFLDGRLCLQATPSTKNIASETVTSQQMGPFVSPSFCFPSSGLLQLPPQPVCVAAWLAEDLLLTTLPPSFPKNSLPLLPLYFILIMSLTTVFCSHYHVLFTSTVHNGFFYHSARL